ncbi:MAG: SURF1 family protein [Gammaproteobacteria bacterium]|nr:SURF1 family protein [Gammaproteobacteria bacterium]
MASGYRFGPTIWPTLATITLLPVLIGLGFWQLERAEQKQRQQDLYNARRESPPKQLEDLGDNVDALQHSSVRLSGRYDFNYQILVDNKVHQGQPGYHVLTPLRVAATDLANDLIILINRGWIPWGESRTTLPEAVGPEGVIDVAGRLWAPTSEYFTLEGSRAEVGQWQPVWQHLDLRRYANEVPFKVYPLVVLLEPDSDAGGFVRVWPTYDDHWVARHRAYAFQWFAMAVALAIIFVAMNFKHSKMPEQNESDSQ